MHTCNYGRQHPSTRPITRTHLALRMIDNITRTTAVAARLNTHAVGTWIYSEHPPELPQRLGQPEVSRTGAWLDQVSTIDHQFSKSSS